MKLKKNVLPTGMRPITTLVFKLTDELPFWKLCTIGASDYRTAAAVPEPTSGLLLLLGVAGLALKRKRA